MTVYCARCGNVVGAEVVSRNVFDLRDSLERGNEAQRIFMKIADSKGLKIAPAAAGADWREHWDFKIILADGFYTVDVKAMKRIARSDAKPQDRLVWVELRGVRDDGWLFGGKADFIAFEREQDFILVRRADLMDLVNRLVDVSARADRQADALYKVYERPGRLDQITLVEMSEVLKLKHSVWSKNVDRSH